METLNPSALADVTSTVSFQRQPESVTLPSGVVSVAGVTVVTGGVELSCGSCMLALGFWGTLIGFSCLGVGVWDHVTRPEGGKSHLLGLGLVVLALSFVAVASVVAVYLLRRKRREITWEEREEGKQVLVRGGRVIKKVTV